MGQLLGVQLHRRQHVLVLGQVEHLDGVWKHGTHLLFLVCRIFTCLQVDRETGEDEEYNYRLQTEPSVLSSRQNSPAVPFPFFHHFKLLLHHATIQVLCAKTNVCRKLFVPVVRKYLVPILFLISTRT